MSQAQEVLLDVSPAEIDNTLETMEQAFSADVQALADMVAETPEISERLAAQNYTKTSAISDTRSGYSH